MTDRDELVERVNYPARERAFHVVRSSDGEREEMRVKDRATLVSIPAPDRERAYQMADALNDVVLHHTRAALSATPLAQMRDTNAMAVDALVTLNDCPPGLFWFDGTLGFKSEYTTTLENPRRYQCDAYVVESGEYFHGGAKSSEDRGKIKVRPVAATDLIAAHQAVERKDAALKPFADCCEQIADAITDSFGPDWTPFDAAHHVMQWLENEGLQIVAKPVRGTEAEAIDAWIRRTPAPSAAADERATALSELIASTADEYFTCASCKQFEDCQSAFGELGQVGIGCADWEPGK